MQSLEKIDELISFLQEVKEITDKDVKEKANTNVSPISIFGLISKINLPNGADMHYVITTLCIGNLIIADCEQYLNKQLLDDMHYEAWKKAYISLIQSIPHNSSKQFVQHITDHEVNLIQTLKSIRRELSMVKNNRTLWLHNLNIEANNCIQKVSSSANVEDLDKKTFNLYMLSFMESVHKLEKAPNDKVLQEDVIQKGEDMQAVMEKNGIVKIITELNFKDAGRSIVKRLSDKLFDIGLEKLLAIGIASAGAGAAPLIGMN